jgi:hypothetical protein
MKILFPIIVILSSYRLNSQVTDSYKLEDTVVVVGKKQTENNINQQEINPEDFHSSGLTNYDLMNYLRIIGTNSALDFDVVPCIEGADFQEQQFFINDIPVPFQSRLLGLQSGLNSLLYSQMSLVETQSLNGYDKPLKLKLKTNNVDTSQIHISSDINILHMENAISLPINNLNGGITIGYNRSLLETIEPFLGRNINTNDFEYKKFPFFQGFQVLGEFRTNNVVIRPIFIYSDDIGTFGLNTNLFNFNSHQFNYGVDIKTELSKLNNSTQIYSNAGKNNIDYSFAETGDIDVIGKTNLSFEEFGFHNNLEYLINTNNTLTLSLGYRYQNTYSKNEVSPTNSQGNRIASYLSDFFESSLYYQKLISDRLMMTVHAGLNSFKFDNPCSSLGLDIYYSDPELIDTRYQIGYESSQEPLNPVFFSFQNTIWDPSSSSSLFFVDNSNLPLKPIKCFNTSLNLRKQISVSFLETNISVKLFLRKLKNLIYANNYPDDVTIYNTDLKFNQGFNGTRYGLSFLIENDIKLITLKNLTSVSLCKSINQNYTNGMEFYALNYCPQTITNLTQYQFGNYFVNVTFVYSSGRYYFNKKIISFYSPGDPTATDSISADYSKQLNLNPYYRMDISFLYKVIYNYLEFNFGISCLNIFDHKNESGRYFNLDLATKSITETSEYFNFPRFLILEIGMRFRL